VRIGQQRIVHNLKLLASESSIRVSGMLLDRPQVQDLVGELAEWLAESSILIGRSEMSLRRVGVTETGETSPAQGKCPIKSPIMDNKQKTSSQSLS